MHTTAALKFPADVLASTQLSAERLAERAVLETALALYRDGQLSSGIAAKWVGESRMSFLIRAAAAGIPLLDDSVDDFEWERGIL